MSDPFIHLRVASGYSLQYGASHPAALVAKAAELEMDSLALTDRDGLYGAVRFAKACRRTGIAPIIGVDLAVPFAPGDPRHVASQRPSRRSTAARGGELRDPRLPRVVAMATSRAGWAALSRLITATHQRGERGDPVSDRELIAEYAQSGDLLVMLGADSNFGLAVCRDRVDQAADELHRWLEVVDRSQLIIAATNHQVSSQLIGSARQAGGMVALADQHRLTAVLTNQVRMAERHQAATVDVLDAARRLVPLDVRNVDRRNAEGYVKSGKGMIEVAREVASLAGRGDKGAEWLIADTRHTGIRCRLDPRADIGLGEIHLPEFDVLGTTGELAMGALRQRCEVGMTARYTRSTEQIDNRLADELAVVDQLGFASYFLTVADVVQEIRTMNIRCAARGSGAGSLINYLLGISGVDPIANGLIMERFLSPLRQALPDIDLDVESARRLDIYRRVLDVFGTDRVACVAMMETYRVRHAVRDVGAALSLPPLEIDAIAKSFPHIRARDARSALRDLPELRAAGLGEQRLSVLFNLVESLDGLPRHVALHPCGVLLSDLTLGDRTPMESSFGGFPMSQFDKDDVEDMGLLKLDVLGIRMQSSMAHALDEIERTGLQRPDIDALAPFDDPDTYDMIGHAATLGCFQIESPGQRELVGKFGPDNFNDIIIDISLFRPGPVKSDMVTPFLNARQGWQQPAYLHPDLEPALAETRGVVVFHEQVIKIISVVTGCSYAQADEARRALGDTAGQLDVQEWLLPTARQRGYSEKVLDQVWMVLKAFASFGFCKAHAAAFALPTYQSAWLKRHYPAHFLAGVLTHDPGMYPKRLILEEARRMSISILGVDVNRSDGQYRVEQLAEPQPGVVPLLPSGLPSAVEWGIRLSLADIKGISEAEISRIVDAQPYTSITDFFHRAHVEVPVVERLILTGGFDELYGQQRRRDLLLHLADLHRAARGRISGSRSLFDAPTHFRADDVQASGLPTMTAEERLSAELEILGMDTSHHIMDFYAEFLTALGATRSSDLLNQRSRSELLVAGVKVATQTPPIRSGRRVVFLTVDDGCGPVDATFFEDAQGPYAATVFSSWLLVVRGELRRTGPRGVSLRATGAWDLQHLHDLWQSVMLIDGPQQAMAAVVTEITAARKGFDTTHSMTLVHSSGFRKSPYADVKPAGTPAGQAPRKLWHASPGSSGR